MNFTREPIIETVITPKEGCRLALKNSKGGGGGEYFVEAVEVVSFGNAIFFRSLERPKSFLLPVTDYEIVELKETRMVLKSATLETSIKIGGGKKQERQKPPRRKKMVKPPNPSSYPKPPPVKREKGGDKDDETHVSSSILRKLFPPPPTLIKEKLNHYKSTEKINESISKEIVQEKKAEKKEIILNEDAPIETNIPPKTEEKKEE